MISAVFTLAYLTSGGILVESRLRPAGAFYAVSLDVNGVSTTSILEPLNGDTGFRKIDDESAQPITLQWGELTIYLDPSKVALLPELIATTDQGQQVSMILARNALSAFPIGVDYVDESVTVFHPDASEAAKEWLGEGESAIARMPLKTSSDGSLREVQFKVDGMTSTAVPFLVTSLSGFALRHEPRGVGVNRVNVEVDTLVGPRVKGVYSLWKGVEVEGIPVPFFNGLHLGSVAAGQRLSNVLSLRSLGPRRILFDPARDELLFHKPGFEDSVLAAIRMLIQNPVQTKDGKLLTGRVSINRPDLEAVAANRPIEMIGEYSGEQIVRMVKEKDSAGITTMLDSMIQRKSDGTLKVTVDAGQVNLIMRIPGY